MATTDGPLWDNQLRSRNYFNLDRSMLNRRSDEIVVLIVIFGQHLPTAVCTEFGISTRENRFKYAMPPVRDWPAALCVPFIVVHNAFVSAFSYVGIIIPYVFACC